MNTTHYSLPADAPDTLVGFLERWQKIANDHPPTPADMPFDKLVRDNPGLAVVEPVRKSDNTLDFKYTQVGPEHATRTGKKLIGQLFSKVLYPDAAERAIAACQEIMETGTPQYWEFINSVFGSPPVEYGRLLLPLFDGAGKTTELIGNWIWKDD